MSLYLKIPHYHDDCKQIGQAFEAAYLPLSLNMCIARGNQAETKLGGAIDNVCVYPFYIHLRVYKLILPTFLANRLLIVSKKIWTGVKKNYLMRYLRMLSIPALYSTQSLPIADIHFSNNVILDLLCILMSSLVNEIATF